MINGAESMQSSNFYVHSLVFFFFFARLSCLEADMDKTGEPEDDVHCSRRWNSEHINMIVQKGGILSEPYSGVITMLLNITVTYILHTFLPVVQVYTKAMAYALFYLQEQNF